MAVICNLKLAAFLSFSLTGVLLGSNAQAEECTCIIPQQAAAGGVIGSITALSGKAILTSSAGPASAATGSTISNGDQLAVGSQSSASVALVNGCSLQLPSGADLVMSSTGDNICVTVNTTATSAPIQAGAGASSNVPLGMFGAMMTGAAIMTLTEDDSVNPVSP